MRPTFSQHGAKSERKGIQRVPKRAKGRPKYINKSMSEKVANKSRKGWGDGVKVFSIFDKHLKYQEHTIQEIIKTKKWKI